MQEVNVNSILWDNEFESEISLITFIIKDLEKATTFFRKISDTKEVYYSGEK